jgi:ATP-dependent helicase/nuclease subunit B
LLEGEDWLGNHRQVAQAVWVSLRDEVVDKGIDDVSQRTYQVVEQLRRDLESVWGGQPMPANGAEHVCQYCESRGLCRKGMWE